MADVAHNASGPALPRPSDIAPQQASRADAADRGKLRVFISYSRDDLDFADQLDAALNACGFECIIDRHGISGGEDWKRRLGNLIREADTVVFVLSPTSARSEICAWEVEEAARLGKRILPINCRPLEGASPPPQLRERNYIFFHADPKAAPGAGFGTGLAKLIAALNTDFDWLREHTRYLQRAIEWQGGGRPANRLLSGDDIAEAKAWVARRPKNAPEPTALHLDFIRASEEEAEARSSAQRKQLEEMAAAQAERESALHKAEEAQRKRATMARIRNIAFVLVSIFAVIAGWLYLRADKLRQEAEEQRALAENQRAAAEEQRQQADQILAAASNIFKTSRHRVDPDVQKEFFAVFQTGADHGDAASMGYLGLLYHEGFGVTQDYVKAREWMEKAADKGDARSMRNLGRLYVNGKDYATAREWYLKAAGKGDAAAMSDLGLLYDEGFGVAKDHDTAREWYEKAAEKGDAGAMFNLALVYAKGLGVAQDYMKAREWYEKAAEKGDAGAMLNLGVLYNRGLGGAEDYIKAREWYEKAADKGNARAMFNLGELYANGEGVKQDLNKQREWYEKAAAKDNVRAMSYLARLYKMGLGGAQDYMKAREWYEKAAEKGGREWLKKAANNGDASAIAALQNLSIREAAEAGRYAEALQMQEALAAKVEAVESKRKDKPGEQTAQELKGVAWHALFAREFRKAFTVADRAHALLPNELTIEACRAHALMFLGRGKESKALYLAHKGKEQAGKPWERTIVEDFAEFRKAGLTHPMMADIEKELGVSR
jgi:TPR repeat protein